MYKKIVSKIKLGFVPCEGNQFKPYFLKSDFLFCLVVFLLILKLVSVPFFLYFSQTSFFADITKTTLIGLVNKERVSLGFNPLTEDLKLSQAAYLKASDMIAKDYFAHQTPEGFSPWYWFKKVGYDYKYAGENLAIGFLDSGEVHQAWLDSLSHKNNLLNPKYEEIGIGIVKGDFQGNETIVVVQLLGSSQGLVFLPVDEETDNNLTPEENEEEEPIIAEESEQDNNLAGVPVQVGGVEEEKSIKDALIINSLKFFYFDYDKLIERIAYLTLILVVISLMIVVLVRVDIFQRDLVLRAVILIIFLSVSIVLDRGNIVQLIPHNLTIYGL